MIVCSHPIEVRSFPHFPLRLDALYCIYPFRSCLSFSSLLLCLYNIVCLVQTNRRQADHRVENRCLSGSCWKSCWQTGEKTRRERHNALRQTRLKVSAEDLALHMPSPPAPARNGPSIRPRSSRSRTSTVLFALLATTVPTTMAQSCIPLKGSTQCPAFNQSSVSTDSSLTSL